MSNEKTFKELPDWEASGEAHNAPITKLSDRPLVYAEYVKMQAKAGMDFLPLRMVTTSYPNAMYHKDITGEDLLVSSGIVGLLNDRELVAVLAHELKHREDYWLSLGAEVGMAGTGAATLAYVTHRFDPEEHKGKAIARRAFVGGTMGAVLAAAYGMKEPSFELLADKGPKGTMHDYAALASALRKIETWHKNNGYQPNGFSFARADRLQRWAEEKNKTRSR